MTVVTLELGLPKFDIIIVLMGAEQLEEISKVTCHSLRVHPMSSD